MYGIRFREAGQVFSYFECRSHDGNAYLCTPDQAKAAHLYRTEAEMLAEEMRTYHHNPEVFAWN